MRYWQSATSAPRPCALPFQRWWPEVIWHHTGPLRQTLCVFGRQRGCYIKQWLFASTWLINRNRIAIDVPDKPADSTRKLSLSQPQHHLRAMRRRRKIMYSLSLSLTKLTVIIQKDKWLYGGNQRLPYTFMGIPPERHHFVDLQTSCSVGSTPSCPESTILHPGQEVFWKRTANVVVITVLEHTYSVRRWK